MSMPHLESWRRDAVPAFLPPTVRSTMHQCVCTCALSAPEADYTSLGTLNHPAQLSHQSQKNAQAGRHTTR